VIDLSFVQRVAIWLLPVLLAITVHEVAHGWVARLRGDPTAMMLGRLTLNPLKHVDPVGTILVPGLLILLPKLLGLPMGVMFGWARPVPVTWQNLKKPKRDMALVALAGPGSNLLMGIGWALILKLGVLAYPEVRWLAEPLIFMGIAGIFINTILMVLNLVPLPPLDGGRVLTGMLPNPWAWRLARIEPYGLMILMLLLFSGVLGRIVLPAITLVLEALAFLAGVPEPAFHRYLSALIGMT
jgi:Zn-dependent protease